MNRAILLLLNFCCVALFNWYIFYEHSTKPIFNAQYITNSTRVRRNECFNACTLARSKKIMTRLFAVGFKNKNYSINNFPVNSF